MSTHDSSQRIDRISQMPQDILPARDLWPSIAAQLEPRKPRSVARWSLGLAAGVALLGLGVLIGRQTPATLESVAMPATVASFEPGETYQRARAVQIEQLPATLAALAPESRRQVLASLETLRRSLGEIRQALGEDPANLLLQSMLVNTYQEEMRVLTSVNEAGPPGEEI